MGTLADLEFEAVIFDMDGTLIDSTPAVIRSWAAWASEHDLSADQLAGFHGVPAAGIVRRLLPQERWAAALERINDLELNDVGDIDVLPGAAEALAVLPSGQSAIATSCTRPLAEARIAAARLRPPAVLVTVDDVRRGKPAPDPFLEAARRLGAHPTRCLVVEDAPMGLAAARAAGCATLAVSTTTAPDLLEADAVVVDLSAVSWRISAAGVAVRPGLSAN
nr:HAD-IA family hydrolase [Microlunatus panaciterrae]